MHSSLVSVGLIDSWPALCDWFCWERSAKGNQRILFLVVMTHNPEGVIILWIPPPLVHTFSQFVNMLWLWRFPWTILFSKDVYCCFLVSLFLVSYCETQSAYLPLLSTLRFSYTLYAYKYIGFICLFVHIIHVYWLYLLVWLLFYLFFLMGCLKGHVLPIYL